MRSPLTFSEVSVNPSFLRTTPAKKPRTECSCQPVTFMMAVIVAPLACPSKPRTASCLVSPRLEDEGVLPGFVGLFVRPLARASLVLLGVLPCDILGSLSGYEASRAVTTEAPQWRHRQRGGIRIGQTGIIA